MQSNQDLFPGIKLFFQLGNFFIMDSETLTANSFQETHQTAISEVLKKNSLTEKDTSIKNRVCENHFNMVRVRLDHQRARRLRQLLDHSYILQHEATLLHLDRQRQAIEVKTRLQPDAHSTYEDIRLRSRERHMGVHMAPCYLDKRQQFPVRLRSTKDNSLTPMVRRARARLKQHQLEARKSNNSSASRSYTAHGANCTSAPLGAASTGLQKCGPRLPTVSAVSEPARRSHQGFGIPTGLPYAAFSIANPAIPAIDSRTNSFHYDRTHSSQNNRTKYTVDNQRNSSSYYKIHSQDNRPHSSLPNHISSIHNHTYPSLPNHTSSLSNPITPSFDNHRQSASQDHTQYKQDKDMKPNGRQSTNEMLNKTASSVQNGGKPVGNSDICDTDPANPVEKELRFSDDDDDDDDETLLEYIDLQAHFYGHHTNKGLHDDFPSTKQARTNELLCRLKKQSRASGKPTGTRRSEATDIQDKVKTFLKNLPPSDKERSTIKVYEAQLISPTNPQTSNSRNMNKSTANDERHDPASVNSELKSSTTPGLRNQIKVDVTDSFTPAVDTDQKGIAIEAGSRINTTPRRSKYSWRDIQVPRRDGHPEGYTAEDLVLQALTGIPIRNVFQTPVPLNTASRAMRHTATFKMHQIVEKMIKERTRYERHQVDELKKQMTMALKGQAIAEEELVKLTAGEEPNNLS